MVAKNLSREYSKRLAHHAINHHENVGKPQKSVAIELDISNENLSKYKNGHVIMPKKIMDRVVSLYGHPRQDSGQYEQVELVDSVDTYLEDINKRRDRELSFLLDSIFGSELAREKIGKIVRSMPSRTREPLIRGDVEYDFSWNRGAGSDETLQHKLDWLESAVDDPAFIAWSDSLTDKIFNDDRCFDGFGKFRRGSYDDRWYDKYFSQACDIPTILLFSHFKRDLHRKFRFSDGACLEREAQQEVVLTGTVILELNFQEVLSQNSLPFRAFLKTLHLADEDRLGGRLYNELRNLTQFGMSSVNVQFFMNKNMQYVLLVTEEWGNTSNKMVIRNIKPDRVIEHFNQLKEAFGHSPVAEETLKSAIAERGGYLPGVMLL